MAKGLFFAFEGTEGSGKSTQVLLLAECFVAAGLPVRTTREPGGAALSEAIRGLLLSDDFGAMDPRTEALLHTAARAEHVASLIRPELDAGTHVLSDRFSDSTLAYQGGGSGLRLDDLRALQRFAIGETEPDQRILLLTSVDAGLKRRFAGVGAINRIDRAQRDFHERVAATFISLAERDPQCWIVVDGDAAPDVVCASLVNAINTRYPDLGLS
ncbi:dTMP kinase [soil metagenome]